MSSGARKPPRRHYGPRPDPDADWNKEPVDVDAAIAQVARVQAALRSAGMDAWNRNHAFFTDLDGRLTSVAAQLGRERRCSDALKDALDKWEQAVARKLGPAAPPTPAEHPRPVLTDRERGVLRSALYALRRVVVARGPANAATGPDAITPAEVEALAVRFGVGPLPSEEGSS